MNEDQQLEILLIQKYFAYNPETGTIRWKITRSSRAQAGQITGKLKKDGYIAIRFNKKEYQAHRIAWLLQTGTFPNKPMVIDHINHLRADNRWSNLRLLTQTQNLRNQWPKAMRYHASIIERKTVTDRFEILINFGPFQTKNEALKARDQALAQLKPN